MEEKKKKSTKEKEASDTQAKSKILIEDQMPERLRQKLIDRNKREVQSKYSTIHFNPRLYFDFINKIMDKMHVLYLGQMITCLIKKFNISDDNALDIIYQAQYNNYIFISQDGFIVTSGYYHSIIDDDTLEDGLTRNCKESYICWPLKNYIFIDDLKYLQAFTVIAQMMPGSEDFIKCNSPWLFSFVPSVDSIHNTNAQPYFYQITYVPEETASMFCYQLDTTQQIENKDVRDFVKRIAVVSDERIAETIPNRLGFEKIVTTSVSKVTVVDWRENRWE